MYMSVPAHCLFIDVAAMTEHQVCNSVLSRSVYMWSYSNGPLSSSNECLKEGVGESVI